MPIRHATHMGALRMANHRRPTRPEPGDHAKYLQHERAKAKILREINKLQEQITGINLDGMSEIANLVNTFFPGDGGPTDTSDLLEERLKHLENMAEKSEKSWLTFMSRRRLLRALAAYCRNNPSCSDPDPDCRKPKCLVSAVRTHFDLQKNKNDEKRRNDKNSDKRYNELVRAHNSRLNEYKEQYT